MGRLSPSPASLSAEQFVDRFGGIYEHSPWVAARTFENGISSGHDDTELLAKSMAEVLSDATANEQMQLIRAHPDLAGKAAARGELTSDSTDEQSRAGLDRCSDAELARFHRLNDAYKKKFDFPFIMAVRDSNRFQILEAFEHRLNNSNEDELKQALKEINKIAVLRLEAMAAQTQSGPNG